MVAALGFTGPDAKTPPLVEMREIRDKEALGVQPERWAHIKYLRRGVVSHGDIVADGPSAALASMSESPPR